MREEELAEYQVGDPLMAVPRDEKNSCGREKILSLTVYHGD
jgi:hypothetical protein